MATITTVNKKSRIISFPTLNYSSYSLFYIKCLFSSSSDKSSGVRGQSGFHTSGKLKTFTGHKLQGDSDYQNV